MKRDVSLHQFFTPTWAAERLFEGFFSDLGPGSKVIEPSCGDGRFLMAMPSHIDAVGVEIDPTLVDQAQTNSGRRVIEGDFRDIDLPFSPDAIIGNPPFDASIIDGFLDRAYETMDYGGRVGFLLPVYLFQTASRVVRYMQRYELNQTLIPRNLFEGMQKPLMFATFTKARQGASVGFFLYEETDCMAHLKKKYRLIFLGNQSRASVWGEAIEQALINLGGEGSLQDIYQEIEGDRPYPGNSFWKAQVRKKLREFAVKVGPSRYALSRQESLFQKPDESTMTA